MVYRGVKADISMSYLKGRIITWYSFSSCTCDLEVQNIFLGQVGPRTLFHIELTTGRGKMIQKYSQLAHEQEVLLPPCSCFEVLGVVDMGNQLTMVHMKELPPAEVILSFDCEPQPDSKPNSAALALGQQVYVKAVTQDLGGMKLSAPQPPPVPS